MAASECTNCTAGFYCPATGMENCVAQTDAINSDFKIQTKYKTSQCIDQNQGPFKY